VSEKTQIEIFVYSRKPLIGRRQWRWRANHINGHKLGVSSESYNNRTDCIAALLTLKLHFGKATVTTIR
jgi:hypothetical protein